MDANCFLLLSLKASYAFGAAMPRQSVGACCPCMQGTPAVAFYSLLPWAATEHMGSQALGSSQFPDSDTTFALL